MSTPSPVPTADRDDSWIAGWDAMVAAVGTDFERHPQPAGADLIEAGLVRRYVEPLEMGCPLHHDPAVAVAHGYPGLVAPASSVLAFMIPPMWSPGDPPVFVDAGRDAQPARTPVRQSPTQLEPPTTGYFATGLELDFVRLPVVGDRLQRRGNRLVDCRPKRTKVGVGAFTTWETEIVDQHGDVVARMRLGRYSYVPTAAAQAAPADGNGESTATANVERSISPAAPVDWTVQRLWEDVAVGDELTPVAFPLSTYRLVVAAGGNRDFNAIHHNGHYARTTGAREMYANTTFLLGMWERAVREFIGLAGRLHQLTGFKMARFNYVDATPVVRGRVERVWCEGDAGFARLEVWTEDAEGVTVGPGLVTVTLPRRGTSR